PRGIVVRNNLLYGTDQAGNLEIGGPGAQDLVFTGNYVPQLTRISFWEELNISDNTFIRNSSMLELYRTSNVSDYEWNNNTFFSLELRYQPCALFIGTTIERLISGESMSYNEWVDETGFDDNSSYVRSAPTPKVFVRPNAY